MLRVCLQSYRPARSWGHRVAAFSSTPAAEEKIVIIGGVAGGATAAARIRRLSEEADVVVLERGQDVSFANCGLPYHIGTEIGSRSALLLHTPQSLSTFLNVDVRTEHEVVKIDRQQKQVVVRNLSARTEATMRYDKLLISTGAAPLVPDIEGIRSCRRIYSLRSMADMDAIIASLSSLKSRRQPLSVTVIGAGFIGLEMVEALLHHGVKVTLVEARAQVLPQMDEEMTRKILQELADKGVTVLLGDRATKFAAESATENVTISLQSGQQLADNDFVILSVGVVPETKLAADCGLAVHPRTKAILVTEGMRTSDDDIFAVGDCAQTQQTMAHYRVDSPDDPSDHTNWVPLAGPANRQARLAAFNMVFADDIKKGRLQEEKYRGSLGTAIVRFGDVVAATTGYTESTLKRLKKQDFAALVVTGYSHASYYPGATPLLLKVTYDTTTRKILGGQATGNDGVDKRIDIIATAIAGGMTVDDLEHLELCYAPPFGSARDIVNTAGFFARNAQRGYVQPASSLETPGHRLVDVRPAQVSSLSPIPGALNIPYVQLRDRMHELDPKDHLTVACAFGKTSYFASRVLLQSGFPHVASLMGGLTLHRPVDLKPKTSSSSLSLTSSSSTSTSSSCSSSSTCSSFSAMPPIEIDTCGLSCPGPIMKIRQMLPQLLPGQELRVLASDSGFGNDFEPFCKSVGTEFLGISCSKGIFTGRLRKMPNSSIGGQAQQPQSGGELIDNKDVAIVLFSGDLDKALAAFVIANGAVAMGGKATIFCTFWGLNALRRAAPPPVAKPLLDRAMSWAMPQGVDKLMLSKMNFGGLGSKFMKWTMKKKQLPSLPGLLQEALSSGQVKLVACGMSMEALGIRQEELIPQCELGGVAQFLGIAHDSKNTLFI